MYFRRIFLEIFYLDEEVIYVKWLWNIFIQCHFPKWTWSLDIGHVQKKAKKKKKKLQMGKLSTELLQAKTVLSLEQK